MQRTKPKRPFYTHMRTQVEIYRLCERACIPSQITVTRSTQAEKNRIPPTADTTKRAPRGANARFAAPEQCPDSGSAKRARIAFTSCSVARTVRAHTELTRVLCCALTLVMVSSGRAVSDRATLEAGVCGTVVGVVVELHRALRTRHRSCAWSANTHTHPSSILHSKRI